MAFATIPRIDPSVKHVGISKLRDLNATKLRKQTDETLVIQENDTPLAVLLSYKKFLAIQAAMDVIDKERKAFALSLEELHGARTRVSKRLKLSTGDNSRHLNAPNSVPLVVG